MPRISITATVCALVLFVYLAVATCASAGEGDILLGYTKASEPEMVQSAGKLTPAYLRCEYKVNPLGIDVAVPRLSWIVESKHRGQKQTAYRVIVAGSEKKLKADIGDLWDTGRVESDETSCIEYTGKDLASRTRCYWKVRVWDKSGRCSGWSRPAMWTMGLVKESDWQGQWVGYDEPRSALEEKGTPADTKEGLFLPPPRYLRKEFVAKRPVRRATVYATALGLYELYINGCRVGEDYFTPGWTDYNIRVYYNTYDVTDLVRKGRNVIGAILADGWYAGYIGYEHKRDHYGKNPRLRLQLEVEYANGSTEIVASDSSWKVATGALLEADFLMGETCDAQRQMPGWNAPGFDDTGWKPVDVTASIDAKLQAYPGVTVRRFAEHKPVSITEPKPGVYVFDMGVNFTGWVRLNVRGKAGDKMVLRFAERLNPDGTIYTANLRSARATDTYICRGGRREIWQPRFTFHGFQYVEVTGYPGRPGPDAVTGIEITSATLVVGSFECSDKMVNQLYGNICRTQRANFIDIPTDCPQRDERLGWTGDAQIYIRTAAYNTDVQAFFTKWLVDLTDAQRADGQFPMVAPLKVAGDDGGPAWADAGIICPWTIFQVYGDRRIIEKHYQSMARFIDFCKGRATDQMLAPKEFHCFGDWVNVQAETPKEIIWSCYFAYSSSLMARIAAALGKHADAERYDELFEQIKTAFNKAYVTEDGRIKGDTQCCYVMAIAHNLLDSTAEKLAAKHLVQDIEKRNWHLSTGFVGTKDLMLVLTKTGRNDVAYRLLHNTTYPSWGFSIKNGATSIWERWDGWTPDKGFQDAGMNSFAHYSFGAVGEWMFKTIGGIDTDGPGFKRIIIRPRPGGKLSWARTGYNSIRGRIATDWKLRADKFLLNVTVPANTSAIVYVPAKSASDVLEGRRRAGKTEAIRLVRVEPDAVVYEVQSGRYAFVSTPAGFPQDP